MMAAQSCTKKQAKMGKVKSLRSTFGPQCLGHIATAPASSFGSSLRDSSSKTYVSPIVDKARLKSQGGNNSPGPIYRQQESVGVQYLSTTTTLPILGFPMAKRPNPSQAKGGTPGPGAYHAHIAVGTSRHGGFDSTKINMPSVCFGNAVRDAQQLIYLSREHELSTCGRDSPGPNLYSTGSAMGSKAKLSTERSSMSPKIGTMPRFRKQGGSRSEIPGPGQYSLPSATVASHQAQLPIIGFTKAMRDANKKIFISLEHEKAGYGENSPGPGTANPVDAVGKQKTSKAKSAPQWSFGSGKRSAISENRGPGPGEYYA